MLLEGEARHERVGLRLEIGAHQAPLRRRVEKRQPRPGHQVVHKGGDEDGFARAREAR